MLSNPQMRMRHFSRAIPGKERVFEDEDIPVFGFCHFCYFFHGTGQVIPFLWLYFWNDNLEKITTYVISVGSRVVNPLPHLLWAHPLQRRPDLYPSTVPCPGGLVPGAMSRWVAKELAWTRHHLTDTCLHVALQLRAQTLGWYERDVKKCKVPWFQFGWQKLWIRSGGLGREESMLYYLVYIRRA